MHRRGINNNYISQNEKYYEHHNTLEVHDNIVNFKSLQQ